MDKIKSAFEKAMERAQQFDEPDIADRLRWKFIPEGRRLAGLFLKGQGSPFTAIEKASLEHRPFLVTGMAEVLISNFQLPKTENAMKVNMNIADGLERLLSGKSNLKELIQRIRYVTDQYQQFGMPQRQQAYQQLKAHMEQQVSQSMNHQAGNNPNTIQLNVETMPEFQHQWLIISGQIDKQYEDHLLEYRKKLQELV